MKLKILSFLFIISITSVFSNNILASASWPSRVYTDRDDSAYIRAWRAEKAKEFREQAEREEILGSQDSGKYTPEQVRAALDGERAQNAKAAQRTSELLKNIKLLVSSEKEKSDIINTRMLELLSDLEKYNFRTLRYEIQSLYEGLNQYQRDSLADLVPKSRIDFLIID